MNRYRSIRPESTGGEEQPLEVYHNKLDEGLRMDLMPRQLPPGASPNLLDVRFERGGFRKDFGDRELGSAAANPILTIIEHKFIKAAEDDSPGVSASGSESLAQFHRLVRLLRNAGNVARTEIWNSDDSEWVLDALAEDKDTGNLITIEDRYVRALSVQNVLLFAVAGAPILIREETPVVDDTGDDFPSGNDLTAEGNETTVTFSSTEEIVGNNFSVNFKVTLNRESNSSVYCIVSVEVDGDKVGSRRFDVDGPNSVEEFLNESISFSQFLYPTPDVVLKLKETGGEGPERGEEGQLNSPETHPFHIAQKSTDPTALDDKYTFHYYIEAGEEGTVQFFSSSDGSTWTLEGQRFHPASESGQVHEFSLAISGLGLNDYFGLGWDQSNPILIDSMDTMVSWVESVQSPNVSVKGYNLGTDGDPQHGLTYEELTGTSVTLKSTDGPEALWLESFADRVVALVDAEDTQVIWWTPSGGVNQWDPNLEGAGRMFLMDTRNDPIDDLQCAAPLSSDTLAIFRSRSIMRGFRTGRVEQAIGVQHWLENLGTESPFSRQVTPVGVIFLGHDRMVYALTENGPRPIGQAIHQDLVERLTGNLDLVDSIFDPVFQHYYMGIPEDGSDLICLTYILDVGKLIQEDKVVWRKRSGEIQRYALASEL